MELNLETLSHDELMALVAKSLRETEEAKAEVAKQKRLAASGVSLMVGQSGMLRISGIGGRYGMNIYIEDADKLFAQEFVLRVRGFIEENRDDFKTRDETLREYWTRIGLTEQEISDREKARAKRAAETTDDAK